MIRVEYNSEAVSAGLERLARGLSDTTPAMQEIGEYLVVSTKDRFPSGKAPDGSPWAAKSQTTIARYLAQGDRVDNRPLFGPSGQLSSTIHYRAGRDQVAVGSALIYSAVMQFGAGQGAFGATSRGSPIPWGDIPARPFLGLSDADEGALIDIVEEYLAGLISP